MKKTVLLAVCAALCLSLCGCDNSGSSDSNSSSSGTQSAVNNNEGSDAASGGSSSAEESIKEKTAKVLSEIEFPSMGELTEESLDVLFGINKDDLKEYSAYICGSGAAPDEFGIFVAKDEAAAKRVKEAVENRVQSQYDTFKSYTPQAMYRFDDDFVELSGTTVIYAICDDNEKAKELLK